MLSMNSDASTEVQQKMAEALPPEVIPKDAEKPEEILAEAVSNRSYLGANILKFFLMPFVCFASFGFPGPFGNYVSRLSLFAPIAFYILCGFLSAARENDDPEIYKRLMKRAAGQFALIFIILIIMNGIFFGVTGLYREIPSQLFNKRSLFEIIILCTWPFPFGETIWFIQALFYARVILWFMNKYGLMKHYKKFLIVTALISLFLGEFAGIIRFNFHGYTYIPGNAITRALPYMLLGRFLYEKREALFSRPSRNYCLAFFAGILAAIAEILILGRTGCLVYTGHMIGYGIMAFSACCFFLKMKDVKINFFVIHGKRYCWLIYVLSQPVGHLLLLLAAFAGPGIYMLMQILGGVAVYPVCLAMAFGIGYVWYQITEEEEI